MKLFRFKYKARFQRRFTAPDIKVFDMSKYDGLKLSDEFRYLASSVEGRDMITDCCNGVGSPSGFFGWLYYVMPNSIYGLDVTPDSDPHDVGYTYPQNFPNMQGALDYKEMIDNELYDNLCITIKKGSNCIMYPLRIPFAWIFYQCVHRAGSSAFLSGKTFDDDKTQGTKLLLGMVLK